MKRTASVVAGLAVAVTAPVVAVAPATAATAKVVKVKDFDFKPSTVRIGRGGIVEWRFRDRPAPHNVTSRGAKRFKSSPSQQSGKYRVKFRRSGTYRYVCTIHPNMRGKVVVG
ncbi:MAG: cupredoxin domain-containing protein [Actinomycetota bacterium]|nr:cupredoxin domain-containing protein [Actinomycetota bacterium]